MMICNYFSFRASHGQPRQTYAINTLAPPLFLALCVCVFVLHRLRQMLLGHWLEQEEAQIACFSLTLFSISSKPVGKYMELAVIRSVRFAASFTCSKVISQHLLSSTASVPAQADPTNREIAKELLPPAVEM